MLSYNPWAASHRVNGKRILALVSGAAETNFCWVWQSQVVVNPGTILVSVIEVLYQQSLSTPPHPQT